MALPKTESIPPQPRSPYAANKVAAEALCLAYSCSYGLDTAPLRYFNIFGPRQSPDNAYAAVIAAFAKAFIAGRRPVIYGDGEQSRDFTFVDNAVHANLLAARHEGTVGGEVLNVACGLRVSVNELAHAMAETLGRPDLTPRYEPERAGDVKHSLADLTRVSAVLGYQPVVDFERGLAATSAWYKTVLPSNVKPIHLPPNCSGQREGPGVAGDGPEITASRGPIRFQRAGLLSRDDSDGVQSSHAAVAS